MLEPILTALPPGHLSPGPRRAWTAALLLFPVALAGGFFLLLKCVPPSPVAVTMDSGTAIEVARAFLINEGIPAAQWIGHSKAAIDNSLLSFVNRKPDRVGLWRVAPPITAAVLFRSPQGEKSVTVSVSLDGKVVGFNWEHPPPATGETTDSAALNLAAAKVPAGFGFGPPSLDKIGSKREYTFRSSAVPDARVTKVVTIVGDRITSVETTAEPSDTAPTERSEWLQTLLTICGSLFLCAVVLFSIYRYTSRTLQQEISHRRSLIVALLCAAFCVLLGFNAVVNSESVAIPFAAILLIFAVLGVMGGALVAAAYGSGEGDVREAFPGKLTSLDALLTGRIFSRNTGISILFGLACAGWLILALGVFTVPFASNQPQGSQAMSGPFIRLGGLMPWVTYPLMALAFAAAGLLQPLAFLQRYVTRRRHWHIPILILCAGLVSMLRTHERSTAQFLVTSALFVVAILVPFFLLDLLSTLVCLTVAFSAVGLSVSMTATPLMATTSLIVHIAAVAGAVLFAMLCLRRGRTFSEEQVRPLYARHIAERKSLEAEVSAAREAQLRLLPDSLPDFAGLDISAACVPAETVGGDFYDFFSLGDGRLGIFIAEGNNRGLAAALTIALAKGYLMQCVERFHDPVEILTRLEAMLSSIFDKETTPESRSALTDFAFASIDTMAGDVRYARTGTYPKVVIVSAGAVVASERLIPVKGRRTPISEGRASIGPGDHIVLFTDGIGRRLAAANRRPEDAAATLITRSGGQEADRVRKAFFSAGKASAEPDDLTLVVIQMRALAQFEGTAALRVVA